MPRRSTRGKTQQGADRCRMGQRYRPCGSRSKWEILGAHRNHRHLVLGSVRGQDSEKAPLVTPGVIPAMFIKVASSA